MPINVVMPQLGESISEGTITRWLKKPGDVVQQDEALFEISTDKVDAEIPSPAAGVLTDVKFSAGVTVQVNMVVAVIDGARDGIEASPESPPESAPAALADPEDLIPANRLDNGKPLRSSPLVRRMARENNLDLRQISGTGLEGRITKEDVLLHLGLQPSHRVVAPLAAPGGPMPPSSSFAAIRSTEADAERNSFLSGKPDPALTEPPGGLAPMTKMRSIIAQRMVESLQISPHVHTVFKVDMTRIARLRERKKDDYEQRNGVKLTYMPFIAVAAVKALRRFPIVNASLEDGAIRFHRSINLGIAVALEWGLIVPVIMQAEERSFLGVARAIADLAGRARGKRLKVEEASGSTFTLTNSGVFGEEFGTPIINQPESAILAIGSLRKEPVVLTDMEGNDSIAIRFMQHFCLGFDHRTIDGADAGKFMSLFKQTLENWDEEIG